MNERIKELAEQAWNYVDNQNPYASDEHEMFQEKFAELIVKECCQKLENDGMVEVAMEMKEHFELE